MISKVGLEVLDEADFDFTLYLLPAELSDSIWKLVNFKCILVDYE